MNLKSLTIAITIAVLPVYASAQSTQFVSTDHHHSHASHLVRPAPTWKLVNTIGSQVKSDAYRNQTHVLIFHLGVDCLHCAKQLKKFAAVADQFRKNKIPIIAISAQSPKSLNETIAAYGQKLPYLTLADASHSSFKSFRAFDNFNRQPLHATIVVDSAGRIRWQNIGQHPFMDCREVLKTALAVRQETEQEKIKRPKIFLDKSPRIVAYQLGRLNNEKLLLVERSTDHPKYAPVYQAILERGGMSQQYRDEALAALVQLKKSDAVTILIDSIKKAAKVRTRQSQQTANELAKMLIGQPAKQLTDQKETLLTAALSESHFLRTVGFAALINCGETEFAFSQVSTDEFKINWLDSFRLVKNQKIRASQFDNVFPLVAKKHDLNVRKAAIRALAYIPVNQAKTFTKISELVPDAKLRDPAVNTLLAIPAKHRDDKTAAQLVEFFVALAEQTSAEKRTTDPFLNAMQLTDQLLVKIPIAARKKYRERLSKVTVRVVKIRTVVDEMRYDIPYFAVQAGRPIQIILENNDMAAHNLVVTKAGKMKQVAEVGGRAGPSKDYLPQDRADILFATKMIQSEQTTRLTFDAPKQPGEYPYVCTFPQHWSRMYGVMIVVDDLDAWLKNPTKPTDPIGNTRQFVKKWTVDDFAKNLDNDLKSRSLEIGAKIYKQANCAQCHKLGGQGATVGPELDTVLKKHKGDMQKIVREILQPSYHIDEKYSMHRILIAEGESITGIIKSETDDEIKLLDNPDSKELITIKKEDIDEMVKTSTSIMPKALLDNFQRDEILELLAYLKSKQRKR